MIAGIAGSGGAGGAAVAFLPILMPMLWVAVDVLSSTSS